MKSLLGMLVCVVPLLSPLAVAAAEAAGETDRQQQYETKIQPLLKKYCFDCHGGKEPTGELSLDTYPKASEFSTTGLKTWRKALNQLLSGEMPPVDAEQPSSAEREQLTSFIRAAMDDFDCTGPIDPGHETIRRLTRAEYKNTIRDLLNLDIQLTNEFPADDVGYGFDNIGDVLSLPPILMEKYLAAAEQIAQQAIVVDPLSVAPGIRLFAARMKGGDRDARDADAEKWIGRTGDAWIEIDVPETAPYLLRINAAASQAGDEPAKMKVSIGDKEIKLIEVPNQPEEPANYDLPVELTAGKQRLTVRFMNDYYNPKAADPRARDRNLVLYHIHLLRPEQTALKHYPASHQKIFAAAAGQQLAPRAAAERVIRRLASRAFRRPASDSQVARFMKLVDLATGEGDSPEESIRLALTAILVSPHFIYKVELDPNPSDPSATRLLDEYELATRLSYFLWSSMPDDELFSQATAGSLRKNLAAQIRRMLADPKATALVDNFAVQWLQLRNLQEFSPSKQQFPDFDEPLRQAMEEESKQVFSAVMREDRSLLDFLAADYTYVNQRLAKHYGIAGVSGPQFRKVSVAGTPRGGILTQAAVLAITSNPTRTSPVKRGKWVMENLLGTPPPPPPPDVPELAEDRRAILSGSVRKRLELHRADPNCAVCHRQMDALGFALENFDAVGAWRDKEQGFAIDASGDLPSGESFTGVAELKTLLRESRRREFIRCLTEKMYTYALGRGIEYFDKCAVDTATEALERDNYRFSTLVLEIIKSEPFQKRRGRRS